MSSQLPLSSWSTSCTTTIKHTTFKSKKLKKKPSKIKSLKHVLTTSEMRLSWFQVIRLNTWTKVFSSGLKSRLDSMNFPSRNKNSNLSRMKQALNQRSNLYSKRKKPSTNNLWMSHIFSTTRSFKTVEHVK